jgi:hypothetical protein
MRRSPAFPPVLTSYKLREIARNDHRPTPTPESQLRTLLQSPHGTLEVHDASHLVVARDIVETWGHLASAALLRMPHHAPPEDGAPPFGCTLAVVASLFVLFLVLVVGHVFRGSS